MAFIFSDPDEARAVRRVLIIIFIVYVLLNHAIRAMSGHSGVVGLTSLDGWAGTGPARVMAAADGFRWETGEHLYGLKAHCPKMTERVCERSLYYTRQFLGLY